MLPLHVTLSYYKRADIRKAMAEQCRGKEVAIKYGNGFGKRPDMVVYDSDILSFAQKKATSFHVSEETWSNPMQLAPGMRKADMDALRVGWDLVLDIDFPVWEATRVIADALWKQLLEEGVPEKAITAKFSGNKGFHIAVPFEAFPDAVLDEDGKELLVSDLFPDGVRSILGYLVSRVDGPENGFSLSERLVKDLGADALRSMLVEVCESCGRKAPGRAVEGNEFVCERCGYRERKDVDYMDCPKCKTMGRTTLLTPVGRANSEPCKCGSKRFRKKVDLAVDTMLVSSRHMYRLAWSLHEKSFDGKRALVSLPIPPRRMHDFDKEEAGAKHAKTDTPFLSRDVPRDCASALLQRGLAYRAPDAEDRPSFAEIEWAGDAAPEEAFPPPIKKMLTGMEDGRKRALFVLTNFLRSVGWSYEMIEARLDEWNKANPEPLREVELRGHIRYHKQKGQNVLPPNFDNDMYYKDLGVLEHDELSRRVKNPVQYVRLKMKQGGSREQTTSSGRA